MLGPLLGGRRLANGALLGALALAHLRVVTVLDRVVRPPHLAAMESRGGAALREAAAEGGLCAASLEATTDHCTLGRAKTGCKRQGSRVRP